MTFTQFLNSPSRTGIPPSFSQLARHDDLWPAHSDRLEDFESFLLARLEDEAEEVIPELRQLWWEYASEVPEGKHDLDLVVACWGDYARHLQECVGTSLNPCEVAEQLLQKALDQSSFDDMDTSMRPALDCDSDADDEQDDEDEVAGIDRGDWAGWDRDDDDGERADLN